MPAHIRTALTTVNLSILIVCDELALGTWQGIYLLGAPHRAPPPTVRAASARRVSFGRRLRDVMGQRGSEVVRLPAKFSWTWHYLSSAGRALETFVKAPRIFRTRLPAVARVVDLDFHAELAPQEDGVEHEAMCCEEMLSAVPRGVLCFAESGSAPAGHARETHKPSSTDSEP